MKKILLILWKNLKLTKEMQLFLVKRVTDQFLVGVGGVMFDDHGRVLLFKHSYRQSRSWWLPGGYIKGGEHPREGLEREILEESGYVAMCDRQLKTRTDRTSARLEMLYTGKIVGGELKLSDEISDAKFFNVNKLPKLPHDQLYFIHKAFQSNFL